MTREEIVALAILSSNNYLTVCHALTTDDLSTLKITDSLVKQMFSDLNEEEIRLLKETLLSMCARKS